MCLVQLEAFLGTVTVMNTNRVCVWYGTRRTQCVGFYAMSAIASSFFLSELCSEQREVTVAAAAAIATNAKEYRRK